MDRVSFALHKKYTKCSVIVAVAESFLVEGAQFFECNPSKKAAKVAVYDTLQAF